MENTMTRKEAAQTLTKLLAKYEELDKTWGGISDKYYEAVTIACGVLLVDDVLNTNPIPPKETKRELLSRFMEFSGQTIACAYWYVKALSDYGINIAERWKTITQQKAALDSAYVQGRNDEAKRFNNADVRPVVRGEWEYDHWCEFRCSNCGAWSKSEPYRGRENFCPNCGADMREES